MTIDFDFIKNQPKDSDEEWSPEVLTLREFFEKLSGRKIALSPSALKQLRQLKVVCSFPRFGQSKLMNCKIMGRVFPNMEISRRKYIHVMPLRKPYDMVLMECTDPISGDIAFELMNKVDLGNGKISRGTVVRWQHSLKHEYGISFEHGITWGS